MTRMLEMPLPTTGIGSLPLTDAEEAASFVLDADLTIPFWPQLPKRYFLEQMIPQYSGGMPCVLPVPAEGKVILEPAAQYRQLETFYEKYLSEDPGAFARSQEAAAGLYAFERAAAGRTWPVVKGQVTGPVTFCTGISGPDKKPLYANEELRDAAAKLLCRKAVDQEVLVLILLRRNGGEDLGGALVVERTERANHRHAHLVVLGA